MLLFDITERKNLVEEGQMMRSYNTNALHTTYSWNIKWQKCAGIGLNGFILKKNWNEMKIKILKRKIIPESCLKVN